MPVFRADTPALNFLESAAEMRALLNAVGLREQHWLDTTARSIELARNRRSALAQGPAPPLGMDVIVPRDVEVKMKNTLSNNERGHTATVQAVFLKAN